MSNDDVIDVEWVDRGGEEMHLKVLDENNRAPVVLLEDDPVTDSGILGWIGQQGNNLWSWLTGGASRSYDAKGNASTTTYVGGMNKSSEGAKNIQAHIGASNQIATNTAKELGGNTAGIGAKTDTSVMQDLGNKVEGWGQNAEPWLKDKMTSLGNFIKENPQTTAIGLGAAGLLGTYYLWKKFTGRRSLTKRDFDEARKIDNVAKQRGMTPKDAATL